MHTVFVHRRGAGQFRHLAAHLAKRGDKVTVISETRETPMPGVRSILHESVPVRAAAHGADHLAVADRYAQHGYSVAGILDQLRRAHEPPDVVVGHIGWGGMLFAKDALPKTPMLGYCEYYFNRHGGDLGFDPAEPVTMTALTKARVRNMVQAATFEAIDTGMSPTAWQRSRYPAGLQSRIAVAHEGIDIAACRPDDKAQLKLPDGRVVRKGDPVVTYVARGLEPYRGFPQFMRAAAKVAARRKDVLFLVAGDDSVSYGRPPPNGKSWRNVMLAETGIDRRRIVFLGPVDHATLIRLFQVSAAHAYLTVPFVLSWSMLEAMACGCLLLGSHTAPVEEVIADGANGILTDFFDTGALAGEMLAALDKPDARRALRKSARMTIEKKFGRGDCIARQVALIERVMLRGERTDQIERLGAG